MWWLYYAGIYGMVSGIRISSLWNTKSKHWLEGRKNWRDSISFLKTKTQSRIWFHVSSLGEFEQARPVIEKIKSTRPSIEIIVSFFSPSGYNLRKNYPHATVCYLPPDLPGNAKDWLAIIQPDLAVFVKYDIWPGYLKELQFQKTPTLLISAHWSPGAVFSSWSNPLTKPLLKNLQKIFLQREEYLPSIQKAGFNNVEVAGDTRIDRSIALPDEVNKLPQWLLSATQYDLVAGSTWPQDEKLLFALQRELNLSMIIAPHEISAHHIDQLAEKFGKNAVLFSKINSQEDLKQILIIDSVGLLNVLYTLGKTAYVGGGFGKSIHNILEPLAHGKPVIFGPHYDKFPEAVDAVKGGFGATFQNESQLIETYRKMAATESNQLLSGEAANYIQRHAGATQIVMDYILDSIPFASN